MLISLTGSICHSLKLTVYRILHFSVVFEENPMFTESKPLSLPVDRNELLKEFGLGSHMNLAVVDPAVDNRIPLGLTDPEFGVEADYFDFD